MTTDDWGPFITNLDAAERRARLRALRAIVRLLVGPRADALTALLRQAEENEAAATAALAAFDRLPTVTRRRALATFAWLHTPARR